MVRMLALRLLSLRGIRLRLERDRMSCKHAISTEQPMVIHTIEYHLIIMLIASYAHILIKLPRASTHDLIVILNLAQFL